jgi:hypothetical protein
MIGIVNKERTGASGTVGITGKRGYESLNGAPPALVLRPGERVARKTGASHLTNFETTLELVAPFYRVIDTVLPKLRPTPVNISEQ